MRDNLVLKRRDWLDARLIWRKNKVNGVTYLSESWLASLSTYSNLQLWA